MPWICAALTPWYACSTRPRSCTTVHAAPIHVDCTGVCGAYFFECARWLRSHARAFTRGRTPDPLHTLRPFRYRRIPRSLIRTHTLVPAKLWSGYRELLPLEVDEPSFCDCRFSMVCCSGHIQDNRCDAWSVSIRTPGLCCIVTYLWCRVTYVLCWT
jgi:hypothetical protein